MASSTTSTDVDAPRPLDVDNGVELEALLSVVPERVAAAVRAHDDEALLEIVLDLGRPPAIRYSSGELLLDESEVTEQELEYVVRQVSEFGEDNRAGIERTLHRISAIRNRRGRIVGLTLRAGRAVGGSAGVVRDLVESGRSILLLGRPGVGKTTMLREAARVLADELKKRVVIVDTSNEIGGDGDIPHPGVGRSRRMQVPRPELQHQVMIEAVENHMPEVIVIDEIGAALEAEAARTIAERGVQLIATAHGNTLNNLMQNPTLSDLIGGIESVTLGDDEARRRGTQKTVLERRSAPTFQSLVEIQSFSRVAVHEDIARTVDALLRGFDVEAEVRTVDDAGDVETVERLQLHGSPDGGTDETADESATTVPPAPGGPPRRILPFGVSRNRLEEAIESTRSAAEIVDSVRDADAVMTLRHYYRQRTGPLREAESRGVAVYVLRNNTVTQMEQSLLKMRSEGEEIDPLTAALREAEEAVAAVSFHGRQSVELAPQNAYIRRLQHELASRHGLTSASRGREPYRRITVAGGDRLPNRELPWDQRSSR
ncbi:MAG: R3H domain-containing nucleic acid-binding protein [Dehalococcoidia bacterium]|nr:R3H domain-containing nucleic acid-binding protein [Dehalococcoidia bacterium]